jgi:hypothetical protein
LLRHDGLGRQGQVTTSRAKAIGAAACGWELLDLLHGELAKLMEDQLSHPHARLDMERLFPVVEEQHPNFATVIAVNNPCSDVDAVLHRKTGPRHHLRHEPIRCFQCHARLDHPSPSSGDGRRLHCLKVVAGRFV